jgi:hypothetical protein
MRQTRRHPLLRTSRPTEERDTALLPRPSVRLPLWSVPVIVAALYVVRSLVRGTWRPEMPMDLVIVVMVVVVIVAVGRLRAIPPGDDAEPEERGAFPDDEEGPGV